jgi:uncharacterized membrane protein
MMLVHFPSALFPVSLLADFIAIYSGDNSFYTFSFYALAAGTGFGWIALVFGLIDLLKISSDHKAFNKALLHGGLNFLWLITFSVLTGLKLKSYPAIEFSLSEIIIKSIVVSGLIFSNFLGGELVLRFGIGKLPNSSNKDASKNRNIN